MEVDFDVQSSINYSDSYFVPAQQSEPAFLEAFINQASCSPSLVSHRLSQSSDLSFTDQKTQTCVSNGRPLLLKKLDGGGEIGGKYSWGDKDGPKWSTYGKGEVFDSKGNYGKAEAEVNSDGTGSVSAAAGHKNGK